MQTKVKSFEKAILLTLLFSLIILSIAIAIIVLNRLNGDGLLIKGLLTGAVYSILTFVIFSILNGGVNWGPAIFTDIIFSAVVGGICSILLNIIRKK